MKETLDTIQRSRKVVGVIHNPVAAWVILGFSVSMTILAYGISMHVSDKRLADRFRYDVSEIVEVLESRLAFNVLPNQLLDGSFQALLQQRCSDDGIHPEDIQIELTEHLLMSDADRLVEPLAALRDTGLTVAIDHSGECHGSIRLLTQLPRDMVKLDEKLISLVRQESNMSTLLQALNSIVKDVGIVAAVHWLS